MEKLAKIAIIGDSISTFEDCMLNDWRIYYAGKVKQATGVLNADDTWWKILGSSLGASEVRSYSYSGSMLEGKKFPAGCSKERIQAVIDDDFAPDAFFVFMGINDYGWGGSSNQAKGGSEARTYNSQDKFAEDECFVVESGVIDRFRESYCELIGNISEKFPGKVVYCCSLVPANIKGSRIDSFAYNLRGVEFSQYNNAISLASKSSKDAIYLPICDYNLAYETLDGTHPTALGMKQIAELMRCAIFNDTPDEALRFHETKRFCLDVCAGCKWAYSTTSKWHCVCLKDDNRIKGVIDDYMALIK